MSRTISSLRRRWGRSHPAQALVEFALTFVLFVVLVMGVLDFGRAIFMYNGLSQAAREIARVTSVHPGITLGSSSETLEVIALQESIVWDLDVQPSDFSCEALDGSAITGRCLAGNWVNVELTAGYEPVTPPLAILLGTIDLASSSSVQITNN